jgi:hypothetical protein
VDVEGAVLIFLWPIAMLAWQIDMARACLEPWERPLPPRDEPEVARIKARRRQPVRG